jgi:hypothetical protein
VDNTWSEKLTWAINSDHHLTLEFKHLIWTSLHWVQVSRYYRQWGPNSDRCRRRSGQQSTWPGFSPTCDRKFQFSNQQKMYVLIINKTVWKFILVYQCSLQEFRNKWAISSWISNSGGSGNLRVGITISISRHISVHIRHS